MRGAAFELAVIPHVLLGTLAHEAFDDFENTYRVRNDIGRREIRERGLEAQRVTVPPAPEKNGTTAAPLAFATRLNAVLVIAGSPKNGNNSALRARLA